jgi:hypothetical protein
MKEDIFWEAVDFTIGRWHVRHTVQLNETVALFKHGDITKLFALLDCLYIHGIGLIGSRACQHIELNLVAVVEECLGLFLIRTLRLVLSLLRIGRWSSFLILIGEQDLVDFGEAALGDLVTNETAVVFVYQICTWSRTRARLGARARVNCLFLDDARVDLGRDEFELNAVLGQLTNTNCFVSALENLIL